MRPEPERVLLGSQPSLESPHNSVHGAMGRSNVMFSFQSAFHPVFWMHHNNIDRFCKLRTPSRSRSLFLNLIRPRSLRSDHVLLT